METEKNNKGEVMGNHEEKVLEIYVGEYIYSARRRGAVCSSTHIEISISGWIGNEKKYGECYESAWFFLGYDALCGFTPRPEQSYYEWVPNALHKEIKENRLAGYIIQAGWKCLERNEQKDKDTGLYKLTHEPKIELLPHGGRYSPVVIHIVSQCLDELLKKDKAGMQQKALNTKKIEDTLA